MANILLADPGRDAAAVTPSDSTHLGNVRSLWIGGAGDVAVVTPAGSTVTFAGATAGSIIPMQVVKVNSTNTTATSIVAIY